MDSDSAETPNFFTELGRVLSAVMGIKQPATTDDLVFSRWRRYPLYAMWVSGYVLWLINRLDQVKAQVIVMEATQGTMAAAEQIHAATKEVQAEVERLALETSRAQILAIKVGVVVALVAALVGAFAGAFAAKLVGS